MALDYHAMSTATDRGDYQATDNIVSNTDKRDVSDMLDLLALAETPFINAIGWGSDSSGTSIEWISEDLGPGYVVCGSAMASTATTLQISTVEGLTTAQAAKQLQTGTILYTYNITSTEHNLYTLVSVGSDGELTVEPLSTLAGTATGAVAAGEKLYILGAAANEGSLPRAGNYRDRVLQSNSFSILREDVQITGSMKETDMYAIGREDQHQILMRLKQIQRDREKQALLGLGVSPRSATEASLMKGALGFLITQGGANIDNTTTTLTKSAVDAVIGACWESGADKLTFFGDRTQCAKFTAWDINRIRMAPRDGKGGGYVQKYMSDVGVEIDIVPLKKHPTQIALLIDTGKCRLRAKKNRKGLMEKLGKMGDFDDWQIISEFSMEMKGANLHQHGLFSRLT